jgi:hypothetical protein
VPIGPPPERLRYRRQFVLGPRFVDDLPGWRRLEADARLRLTVHPDLPVEHAARGERSVTLLGYALDPERPGAADADLAGRLLDVGDAAACLELTAGWGGRYALLWRDGADAVLFHDACGLRQVYWTLQDDAIWCASLPGLLARTLGLERDEEALAYMASRGDDDSSVYWMPGDRSMYREVRCLLPNHLLSLGERRARRFWPRADSLPPPPPSVEAAVREAAASLRGMVGAARRRFRLGLPMTAGWDSRLMLALLRDVVGEVACYTLTYPFAPADSMDVRVPARLLSRLGVSHRVVPYPRRVDERFEEMFRANADAVKKSYCGDAQALYEQLPDGLTCVAGDVAEIVKCFYRLPGDVDGEPTAEQLGTVSLLGNHRYALRALQDWLDDAPRRPVRLLDLFCWEQAAGRWQAQIRSEFDLVQESFAPLNCRSLLARLLVVEEAARRAPAMPFFAALIEDLWPETLAEPINPPEPVRLRRLVGSALRRLGLYQGARSVLRRLRRG